MDEMAIPATVGSTEGRSHLSRQAWLMVWMAMIGIMCCSTSVLFVNVGVFMKPLADSFGWNRGSIASALSIAAVAMAIANPVVGRLIDRFGVKVVLITSLLTYGLVTAAIPWVVESTNLPGFLTMYALVAVVGAGSNVIAYVRLISGWFSGSMDGSRGLALGISSSGVPLGIGVTGPAAVLLVDNYGWQGGYWGLALLPLLIALPIAIFVIRMAPDEVRGRGKRASSSEGMTMAEALRTRHLWVLMVAVLIMSAAIQGVGIHQAPLLTDLKLQPEYLAIVLGAHGVLGVLARISAGFLFDRFFAPRVAAIIFSLGAIASFALAGFPGLIIAVIATSMFPVAGGAESDFIGYVVGKYYGLKCYGEIFGLIYAMFMVGVAVGPLLFGLAFDAWGDYRIPFLVGGIGLAVTSALLLTMPKFPQSK